MTLAEQRTPTPVHLWIVGLVSLLWNSFGCYDYVMTKLDPAGYLAGQGMSAEAVTYTTTLPAWLTVFWALGVWGSLAGSILLLLRSRRAVGAFAISLAGLAISQGYQFAATLPAAMKTQAMWVMSAVIWIVLLLLLLYAFVQERRGVLR